MCCLVLCSRYLGSVIDVAVDMKSVEEAGGEAYMYFSKQFGMTVLTQ